jgi:DNA-binding transcriptional regulator YiaG
MAKHPMSALEFKRAMTRLKVSLADAATLLDVDRSAVIRWRNGTRRVPGPVAEYLRHLLAKQKQ